MRLLVGGVMAQYLLSELNRALIFALGAQLLGQLQQSVEVQRAILLAQRLNPVVVKVGEQIAGVQIHF